MNKSLGQGMAFKRRALEKLLDFSPCRVSPERTGMNEQEQAKLNILSVYLEKMQKARYQETKDSILCQLVLSLLPYVPSPEIRNKAQEILREYNSEERIAEGVRE